MLVATKLLSWETCLLRQIFVATKVLTQQKYFVAANVILLRQIFCRGEHTFVATKDACCCDKHMLLSWQKWHLRQLLPMLLLIVKMVERGRHGFEIKPLAQCRIIVVVTVQGLGTEAPRLPFPASLDFTCTGLPIELLMWSTPVPSNWPLLGHGLFVYSGGALVCLQIECTAESVLLLVCCSVS